MRMLYNMLFQDQEFKKKIPFPIPRLDPCAFSDSLPHSKILDPPLDPATVLPAALTSALSLER